MKGVSTQAAAMRGTMGQVQGVTAAAVNPMNQLTESVHKSKVGLREMGQVVTNQRGIWEQQQRLINSTGEVIYDAAGNARVMFNEMGNMGNQTLTAGKRIRMFNTVLNEGSKSLVKWGKNTQWAGRQLTVGFTVPLMLLGRTAANTAEEYDRAMTRVVKVTNFSAEQGTKALDMQIASVEDQTRRLTEFGASMGFMAEETASTVAEFAQMGFQGIQLDKLSDAALQLSFTTGSELKTSIEATRIAAQAFGIELDDLNEEFARLNVVENNTALSVSESMLGLPVVGAVAKSVGMSLQETNGIMAMMKNSGISAKEGATALRTGLLQLVQDATDPTIAAFNKIGLNINEMKHEMQTIGEGDPLHFFDKLGDHMQSIDVEAEGGQAAMNDFSAALSKLFGVRQTARILSFMDQFNERTEDGTAGQRAWMGVTEEAADVMRVYEFEQQRIADSAAGTADRLRAELNVEMAALGETFLAVANKLRQFAVDFTKWFNNLDEGVKKTVMTLGGMLAVLGPIVMLVGLFANALGTVTTLVTNLLPKMAFMNTSIIAQKVAFASTTTAIAAKNKGLKALTISNIKYAISAKKAAHAAAAQAAAQQAAHFSGPSGLSRGLAAGGGGMGRLGTDALNATGAKGIEAQMGAVLKGGIFSKASMISVIFKSLPGLISAVVVALGPLIAGFAALAAIPILANPGAFFKGFKDTVAPAFESLMNTVDSVRDSFGKLIEQFRTMGGEGSGLSKISEIFGSIAGWVGNVILRALQAIIGLLNPIISIVSVILNLASALADTVMLFWYALTDAEKAEEVKERLRNTFKEIADGIISLFMQVPASIMDIIGTGLAALPIPGTSKLAEWLGIGGDKLREYAPLTADFNDELTEAQKTMENIRDIAEQLEGSIQDSGDYVNDLIQAEIIPEAWAQSAIEAGEVSLNYLESQLRGNEDLTDEMRIRLQTYLDEIRYLKMIERTMAAISAIEDATGSKQEDIPEWIMELEDLDDALNNIHRYSEQQIIDLGNYGELARYVRTLTDLEYDVDNARELAAEKLGYSVNSMGELVDDTGDLVDETEAFGDALGDANNELETLANNFVSTLRSNIGNVMSDISSAVKQTLTDEREASSAAFSARMDNIKDEFSARGDALKERLDDEKEKFKEAHDLRKEQMKERHSIAKENMRDRHELEKKRLKERHELELERLDERRQNERDAIEDAANARIEALQDQQETEDDAERQRERAFEREKARINYLHGLRTGNISMQLALARGELSQAAILREQIGTDTAQFHADAAARERGWEMDDRKRARDAEIDMIKEVLDARLEAFDEETDRLKDMLKEQQEAREEAQKEAHKSQEKHLERQHKMQEKALEEQNKAQQKALDRRHKMMEESLKQEQNIAEQRVKTEEEAAEAGFKAREIAIDNTLKHWQKKIPETEEEYDKHLKELERNLGEHSVSWAGIIDNYSTYTGKEIRRGYRTAVDNAHEEMGENAKWDQLGEAIMMELGSGISGGLGDAFKELAEMLDIELPDDDSPGGNFPNRGGHGVGGAPTGGVTFHHSGGRVFGGGGAGIKPDEQKAILQSGEYVIQRDAVKTVGVDALEQINQAHKARVRDTNSNYRYHSGGPVKWQDKLDSKTSIRGKGAIFGRLLEHLVDHGAGMGFGAMAGGNFANLENLPNLVAPDSDATRWAPNPGWRHGMNARAVGITAAILNAIPGGQRVTSSFRPGARVAGSGRPSQHGMGLAVDIGARANDPRGGGNAQTEREGDAIAAAFRSHPNVGQVLWKTMTGGNHYDHVHAGFRFHEGGLIDADDLPEFRSMNFGNDLGRGVASTFGGALMDKMVQSLMAGITMEPGMISAEAKGPIQEYAKKALADFGWGANQWAPLYNLVQRESNWNPNGQNPRSTAYGLFQFLDSTWAGVGMRKTSDPYQQIAAGLKYIQNRYGSPQAAWNFWQRRVPINGKDVGHWYHGGGEVKMPQLAKGAYVNYDNVVANLHKGETVLTSDLSAKLDQGINRMASGDSFGDFIVQIENFHGTEDNIEKLATRLEQIQEKRSIQRGAKRRFG